MNRLLILEETWKREQKAAEKKKTNSCKEKATEKKGEMVKAMKGMSFFEFYTHFNADFDPTSDKALVPTDSDHAKRWKILGIWTHSTASLFQYRTCRTLERP